MRSVKVLSLVVVFSLILIIPVFGQAKGAPAKPLPTFRTKSGSTYKLGCLTTPKEVVAKSKRVGVSKALRLATAVDLTPGMPPIGNQAQQGSCTAWATTYYAKSYQEGQEHGWAMADTSHQYSPAWTYNQINGGSDSGSAIPEALMLLANKGATSLAQQPYSDTDYRTWPTMEQYLQAMPARANQYGYVFYLETGRSTAIENIKTLLANNQPVIVNVPVYEDFYTVETAPYLYNGPTGEFLGNHALCIVGYDDSIGGIGGFKILNSWGTNWGNSGAAYLSYRFIGDYAWEAWTMTDRAAYQPVSWAKVMINHTWRSDLVIDVGVGPVSSPTWSMPVYNRDGGSENDINCYVDVTDFGTVAGNWWVRVQDMAGGDVGVLNTFSLLRGSAEVVSTETPLTISDYTTVVANLAWRIEQLLLRAAVGPGGSNLTSQNCVTVNYTSYGEPRSVQLWTGRDVSAEVDLNTGLSFSPTSSGSGATERWARGPLPVPQAARASQQQLYQVTYYHQLRKRFATQTNAAPLLGPDNHVPVTYQNCGLADTAGAYDGITDAGAVWADLGSAYFYATTSSRSGVNERWASRSSYRGTVENNDTVTQNYWHQYAASLTLAGTDATRTTRLNERTVFGQALLRRELHTSWTDWVDADTALRIRDYTEGEERLSTLDPTSWIVSAPLTATCEFLRYYVIAGRVRDTDGSPVQGIRVRVNDQELVTDADGLFKARNLPPGTYQITPTLLDSAFMPASRTLTLPHPPGVTDDATGMNFQVAPRPQVVEWSPTGQAVSPATQIRVRFSQGMDPGSVEAALMLYEIYPGGDDKRIGLSRFSWEDGNRVVVVTPNATLRSNRGYRVKVAPRVRSMSGAPMSDYFEWTFQTTPTLIITNYGPTSGTALLKTAIVIEFDRDVNEASVRSAFETTPAIPGEFTFPTGRKLRFVPSSPLTPSSTYTVNLAATARGLDGVRLESPHSWQFTTQPWATVASVSPRGENVPVYTPVVVNFAQPMERPTAQQAFALQLGGVGEPLPGAFSWDAEGTVMTFKPAQWLKAERSYAIRVAASATATSAAPMAREFRSSFRTGAGLHVASYSPQGNNASVRPEIRVVFDRPINAATLEVRLQPGVNIARRLLEDGRTLIITPRADLALNSVYRVFIARELEARDNPAETLGANFAWEFTTHGLMQVTSAAPRGADILPTDLIRIAFDQRLDPASLQPAPTATAPPFELWMEMPVRKPIPGRVSLEEGGKVLVFTPRQRLESFSDYRVMVQRSVTSRDGTPLGEKLEYMFQTASFLQITDYEPRGDAVAPAAHLVVSFDRDVNRSSFVRNFTLSPALTGRFEWTSDREVHFIPEAGFAPGQTYNVTVSAGTRSTDGLLRLLVPFAWEFTVRGAALAAAPPTAVVASQTGAGQVAVSFRLAAAATVELRVLNVAGRLVGLLPAATATAGDNTLLWNARSQGGTQVPAGSYLVQVLARSADGAQYSTLAPLQLR